LNVVLISLVFFAFVIFRCAMRAFNAYQRGYRSWPALAALAVGYLIFGILRRFSAMDPTVFFIGSVVCIIASQMIYRASARSGM
jgi:hypothetical protein